MKRLLGAALLVVGSVFAVASSSYAANDVRAPSAPLGVKATAGDASATVSWSAPADDGGAPVIAYEVIPDPAGAPVWTDGATRSVVVGDLVNGTTYTFTVVALNRAGPGVRSNPTAAVTPMTVPSAPLDVRIQVTNNNVTVLWKPPASTGGSPILRYTIEIPATGASVDVPPAVTSFDFTSLSQGTNYMVVVVAVNSVGPGAPSAPSAFGTDPHGYWLAGADGGVFSFGDARFFGSAGNIHLSAPIVSMASTATGHGYWLAGADGGVFAFGDAPFLGSTGATRLNAPIVGMAPTTSGHGYWLAAADGGVFAFGDARFLGSTAATRLNAPVVAMARTISGRGYWLAAADGGVFSFGDAPFLGSAAALRPHSPIVAMTATAHGAGYWLAGSDGGVFAFGNAPFLGSSAGTKVNSGTIRGMAATADDNGYWLAASNGGIFSFGETAFFGSAANRSLSQPIVAMARPPATGA